MPNLLTIAALFSFLAACSSAAPTPPPQKTVFDPLTQQVERAKDVQNTVDQQAARTRDKIDSEERGDAPPKP